MRLRLPPGARMAVAVTVDFDGHSMWMGTFGRTSPAYLSRGDFGADVGAPRLLRRLEQYAVASTWCVPGHTLLTWPHRIGEVVDAGHEIAAHGCYHEPLPELDEATERDLMARQLEQHDRVVGRRPRGYRSPAWDFTEHTLAILEEHGFDWDSSLMGDDFSPYRIRRLTRIDRYEGNAFGPPSMILEIPVSWHLDDFPALEFVPGELEGMSSTRVVLDRWIDTFDYGYAEEPGGVLTLTLHPQAIGRPHHLLLLDRFLRYVADHGDVWFATLSEIHDAWYEPG